MTALNLPRPVGVSAQMWRVNAALLPGILALCFCFGPRVLMHVLVASVTAVSIEALVMRVRRLPQAPPLLDGSVVLLGLILGCGAAPYASPLVTISATGVAVLVGKHVYGGLGNNLFNPAMVGYAYMLVCFPLESSQWRPAVDGVTGATVLTFSKAQLSLGYLRAEFMQVPAWPGLTPWPALGFALGGLGLVALGIVRWRIPVSMLLAFAATALVFFTIDPSTHLPPLTHLLSGSLVMAAFFVATDPVTSPVTPRGQLLFGAGIGVLVYLLRVYGAYADGVAFAVLMMNVSAAWLDGVAQPYSRRIS